mgnify:CR=1 FL=1
MKVFLSGYGKMGRMLEELALERGWDIVGHADITCPEAYETAPGADVCLDFSGVGALKPLLGYLHRTKTALVSGTTGLTEPDLDALQELGRELPVIWTANYSTGIAVFRRMLHDYAGVLAGWDKEIVEIHHNQKRRAARQSSCCRSWTPRARRRFSTAARASAASGSRRRSACSRCAAARSRASIPSISSARTRRCRSRTELRAAEFLRRALCHLRAGPRLLYARRAAV